MISRTSKQNYDKIVEIKCFLGGSADKNPLTMREALVQSPAWEDPLEEGMATYSSILVWRFPWTIMYSQRVGLSKLHFQLK